MTPKKNGDKCSSCYFEISQSQKKQACKLIEKSSNFGRISKNTDQNQRQEEKAGNLWKADFISTRLESLSPSRFWAQGGGVPWGQDVKRSGVLFISGINIFLLFCFFDQKNYCLN